MLMDAAYLEQSLQLQDIWRIFIINQGTWFITLCNTCAHCG